MEQGAADEPRRGRPRVPGTDEAILDAARSLLLTEGWEGFSLSKVAQQAGVGKPTVYRRWASRAALVYDAMFSNRPEATPVPDTGSARDDLRTGMLTFVAWFSSDATIPASRAILAEILTDAAVSHRFLMEQLKRDHELITDVVLRDVSPGSAKPREYYAHLAELAVAWIVHRCVIMADPPTEAEIDATIDVILSRL